ncbi:MAG TPA: Ig-like domain repeat protein [Bryobacteraceae bacterium]|jgi:hypothetical protein|nr:Ig-like domain repeat protein [Bryobacteraceae bacterium]
MKLSGVLLAITSLLPPALVQAQTLNSVVQLNRRTPVEITNHSAQMIGPYNSSQKLGLAIGIRPPKQDEEQKFLAALYTPGSPEYRKFLTAEEWNARFSPSLADEQAVVDWAIEQGFTITKRYPNHLLLDVEAPVAQIQRAFGVNINRYQMNGDAIFSNDRDPVIPDSISHVVTGVFGMNNIQIVRPHSNIGKRHLTYPDYAEGPVAAQGLTLRVDGNRAKLDEALAKKKNAGLSPAIDVSGFYEPTDLMGEGAYDLLALSGLGHCCNPNGSPIGTVKETSIAILSFGAIKQSDITGFQQKYPYLALNFGVVNVDGTSTTPDGEGTLDVEWATAMGNSFGAADQTAQVLLYEGASPTHKTFLDAYQMILSDNRTRIMSTSWGGAEVLVSTVDDMISENAILDSLAGQGWTLIAASDDRGSVADCKNETVDFPASSPDVIAAGGTLLTFNTDSTFKEEVAWTGGTNAGDCRSNDGGGGGGFSAVFGAPFYQAYLQHGVRTVPDISLNASFPQVAFIDGDIVGAAGTSIVAPELAGFFAQENAYLLYLQSQIGSSCFGNHACAPIGNANYPIYIEQQLAPYAPHYPFYDVTQGCAYNDVTFNNPNFVYYCAGPGYDMATGLGSFNMLQLAWAINYDAAGDFGPPTAAFSGASPNTWYNQDQTITMVFTDTTQTVRPATGVAGFTAGWDHDPAPESFSKATPGFGDAFYQGPQVKATTGSLKLSAAGQGCHTAMAKAWDNTGTSSGLLSYGPVCFDTVAPVSKATLTGTGSGNVFTSSVKVTLSATDQGSGVGSISYSLDGATFTIYSTPFTVSAAGSHTVRYFSKDKAGNTEQTKTTSFTINSSQTKATVASSLNPSTYGLNVTFTAAITAATGTTPAGTVTFLDGTTTVGVASVSSGHASFVTRSLHAGAHSITAVYSGNAGTVTSAPVIETVNKSGSTATISSSLNPSTYGSAITFTASVAPAHNEPVTGTVNFKDGTVSLGAVGIDPATHKASLVKHFLAPGTHQITATYGGSADFVASVSPAMTETINKATTSTTIASSLNPSAYGKSVTFTATVTSPTGGSAGGTATFKSSGVTIGTGTLNSMTHQATFAMSTLIAGPHQISATYAGNTNEAASSSAVLTETVDKAATTTTLASSGNPSTHGTSVTFTATVASGSGTGISGTVTFKSSGVTIASAPVNSTTHKATLTVSTLSVGTHSITASYGGNSNLNSSNSAVVSQVVH